MKFLERFDKRKLFNSKFTIIAVSAIAIIGGVVIFRWVSQKKQVASTISSITIKPTLNSVSEEQLWRQSLHDKLEFESKKLFENIAALTQNVENNKKESLQERNAVKELKAKLEQLSNNLVSMEQKAIPQIEQKPILAKNISQYNFPLENHRTKTADNYIPAGSFAKAVLLSGVDAATSLSSQNDPDPVLIRIMDHGTLPRRFKSDLKDCHIIGSSYGDLSSERAKIRLEKLSCTEITTGEVIETEVAGFVTGEDGRQGVRGSVVSTEGKLLGNSLLSGVLSGLANNFSAQPQSVSLFPSSNTPDTREKLKHSMLEGASSSLDRLSKYYIERAESLQPIVQVEAGRKIDVIFTEGVFFGTSSVKRDIAKKRENQQGN